MAQPVIVTDARVATFVSEKLNCRFVAPFTVIGVERANEIVAGCLFNVFEGADVHVSLAGSGWSRRFIRAVGVYVYGTLKCERMTAITESDEVTAYALRLGGKIEGYLRNHFGPGRDAILVGILRDEWLYGNKAPLAHG